MKRFIPFPLVFLIALSVLTSCGSGTPTPSPSSGKKSIATAQAGALTVEILTDSTLEVGLTPVYLEVTNTVSGASVADAIPTLSFSTNAGATLAPDLGAPVLGSDGLYQALIIFQKAGEWSATVGVQRPGVDAVEASFPALLVAETGRVGTLIVTDPVNSSTSQYIVSLDFEAAPKVGLNPVIVTIHQTEDGKSFSRVDDATLVLGPEMPSMGHGSPGSVNPTLTSSGRYEGQLSFSMPGEWKTTITLSRPDSGTLGAVEIWTTF